MKKWMYGILILAVLSSGVAIGLAILKGSRQNQVQKNKATPDMNSTETQNVREITYYNWKDYTALSVLEDFEKETGIKVNLEEYETIDEMLTNVQANPNKYDVVNANALSIMQLIDFKLAIPLDHKKLPNLDLVENEFKNLKADPGNQYSIPLMWSTQGLVVNKKYVHEPVDSWKVLFDPKYKNKIRLFDDPSEATYPLLEYLGSSITTYDPNVFEDVRAAARQLKNNGITFGETFTNIEDVAMGKVWIAEVFNGDYVNNEINPENLEYVIPKEGIPLSIDLVAIMSGSDAKDVSHKFMNYLLRPEIMARTANEFKYAASIPEASQFIDKEILENPVIYPPKEDWSKGEIPYYNEKMIPFYNEIYGLMH
jgi:spermidine/putrescine transport system substrate-binding protein